MSTLAKDGNPRREYLGALAMLGLALAFPIALMVFNPTLMFRRGWEQYVGTTIYLWAVVSLGRELRRLWRDEKAFADGDSMRIAPAAIDGSDRRLLPARLRQLLGRGHASGPALMELNREASALDQEAAHGRFTVTRYILYLLPVIGFIGTVEGISHALMNISRVLPMVKDLDGFMGQLTSVTDALQVAFDSTLLALFLSAALMLAQTLVYRRAEELLGRVDRWVVEHVLISDTEAPEDGFALVKKELEALSTKLGADLGDQVGRFAVAIDRLAPALSSLERGAGAIGRVGDDLVEIGQAGEAVRRGAATLGRIESALTVSKTEDDQLEQIRRGVDRSTAAIEAMAGQWSMAFERSSRTTQEQLGRTLSSLKDALDLLNVSMEQGNALYRNIVRTKFQVYREEAS